MIGTPSAAAVAVAPSAGLASAGLPSDQDASGRSLGAAALERLNGVIERGVLTATTGPETRELEERFAALLGARHAIACSSGTAAVHTAVVALDPDPGAEIVTTPITDMGALSPLLVQGAIPVFADVDPRTGNVTPETVAARLSDRTRAVVATHLFGNPCDIAGIVEVADRGGIPVIEDAAQALLARRAGRPVGRWGALGCFSTQQGKHITSGEGGLVVTDDGALARRARLAVNKGWPYGEPDPDHELLALNARMSELQAAVLNAQLDSVEENVRHRVAMAQRLTDRLQSLDGVALPLVRDDDRATWWRYPLLVDRRVVPGGPEALADRLRLDGVAATPRYIRKPAFACRVFTEQRTFGGSHWPFPLAQRDVLDYSPSQFPGTFAFLDAVLVLPWNERYMPGHVDAIADALRHAVTSLVQGPG